MRTEMLNNLEMDEINELPLEDEVIIDPMQIEGLAAPFDPNEFYENLVDKIKAFNGESYLQSLANQLITEIEEDEKSMNQWNSDIAKGMSLLGYKIKEVPTDSTKMPELYDTSFSETMNSIVMHVADEILKPDACASVSPIDTKMPDEIYGAADFCQNQLNHYLTLFDEGFYPDVRQSLVWFVLTGNLFRKVYTDETDGLVKGRYITKLIINNTNSNINESTRITEQIELTKNQIITRIQNGFFAAEEILPNNDSDITDPIKNEIKQIEGKSQDANNDDVFSYYISSVFLPLTVSDTGYDDYEDAWNNGQLDKIEYPYKVWIDVGSKKIMRIERAWDPRTQKLTFKDKYYHWKLFNGFDFFGLGLSQMCGNNANIINFINKQILDSALKANHPGYIMSSGLRNKESTLTINPSTVNPIEAIGEIGKTIMPVPTKEPSQMLYQMLTDIKQNVRAMGASIDQMGEYNPNIPVGTIITLIEQYMKLPNHVVRQVYNVFSNELQSIATMLVESQMIPMDFGMFSQLKVTSIANPHLSSNIQRSLQAEFLMNTYKEFPQFFNAQEVFKYSLNSAKIENPDKYLNFPPPPPQPMPFDPVNENLNISNGIDAIAVVGQNHEAHIIVHTDEYMQEMAKPQPDLMKASKLLNHIGQHRYLMAVYNIMMEFQAEIPDDPVAIANDIELQNLIAQKEAEYIEQQKSNQNAPMDPTQALLEDIRVKEEIGKIKEQANLEIAQLKAQVELMKAEMTYKTAQEKNEIDLIKLEKNLNQAKEKTTLDNNTKMIQHQNKMDYQMYKDKVNNILTSKYK